MVTHFKTLRYSPLLAVLLSGLSIPKKTDKVHFIYSKKMLNIQTSKNDPPRIAFEMLNRKKLSASDDWNEIKNKPSLELSAGNFLKAPSIGAKTVYLAEMKITKGTPTPAIDWPSAQSPIENLEGLTPAEQQRLVEAKIRYGMKDSDWSAPSSEPSLLEALNEKIRAVPAKRPSDKIFISGADSERQVTVESNEKETAASKASALNHDISGMIELKALPPPNGVDWQIRIARYDDGVKIEDASFDSKKSVYKIHVADLEGSLRAELFDVKTGEVVGEGTMRLADYNRSRNPRITVRKSNNYYAANFTDFYESSSLITRSRFSKKQPETKVHLASLDTGGRADGEGNYRFDSLHKNSWMILRALRKGYSQAIYLSPSGEENSLPLLPEKMVAAMRNIISDQRLTSDRPANGSIVWGQAVQGNQPQKGVAVKIQETGDIVENYKPIYFNQLMIPDPKMTETGENGFFAFVDVEKGFHTVVGEMSGINTSFQNLIVDDEVTSSVVLQNDFIKNEATVKVYDSLSGRAESAALNFQSLPQEISVHGITKIQTSGIKRLGLVQVLPESEEYLPSLQVYNDDDENIRLPLIQKKWLYDIQGERRINRDEKLGAVIGFVSDWNFKVYMGHHENFTAENIVYFDSQGNPTSKGTMGGGFIIFNVPTGVESIVISDESSELLYNQVVPVDPSSLVTLKY